MLADGGEQLPEAAHQELALSIVDEADRLNRLVANLLDLTKLEAGALRLDRQLQPIEEVIGVVLQRFERQRSQHPIVVNLPDDLPPVAIDGLLLQQVLANLLDNAVKFSPEGTNVELSASHEGESLVVAVADRGPGLPAGTEQKVFEKFFRAEGATRSGSGIGLAICRGIVQLHGGRIFAENRPGGGAIFRFTLPLTTPTNRSAT